MQRGEMAGTFEALSVKYPVGTWQDETWLLPERTHIFIDRFRPAALTRRLLECPCDVDAGDDRRRVKSGGSSSQDIRSMGECLVTKGPPIESAVIDWRQEAQPREEEKSRKK
jgi:hypothetical protein